MVITHVPSISEPDAMSLLYVGMTRALYLLDIPVGGPVREEMLSTLLPIPGVKSQTAEGTP